MGQRNVADGYELYADGQWSETSDRIAVTDLASGGEFASVAAASPADVDRALAAAARADTGATTLVERARWLERIADGIEARADELAETIVREAGKPIGSARSEVAAAAERFRRAVGEARNLDGEFLRGTTESHEDWEAIVRPEPMGVVACVTPYNYPLSTTALHVAPALAAGNAVVLKPASDTPVSAAKLAEIIVAETDLPDGGFTFLSGRGSEIGDALASDDRLDAIAMTGSTAAGKRVADASGMVQLHMELGGNAPVVVFPDADLDAVADGCTTGALSYAGQRCSAVSRVLAHETVHDDLVARLDDRMADWTTGDLFDEETKIGPLISTDHAEWVEELIADAVDRGARLVRGGGRDGQYVEPTLLADVPHDARVVHEEQFGPIAAVVPVADEETALSVANAGELGLDAAVFTADHDRAMRVADEVEAGAVRINGVPSHGIGDVPFGGVKQSGIGREGIGYAIEAFVDRKTVVL